MPQAAYFRLAGCDGRLEAALPALRSLPQACYWGLQRRNAMRMLLSVIPVFSLVTFVSPPTRANPDNTADADVVPAGAALNACGCYRDAKDQCRCNRVGKAKLKCECENDCEPPECAAKRKHDEDKAAALALKKIKERDKKAQAEAKKAQAKRAKDRAAEEAKKEKEREKANSDPRWKLD
jgi:hypothetical protein